MRRCSHQPRSNARVNCGGAGEEGAQEAAAFVVAARCGRCGSACCSSRFAAAWCVHASSCGSSAVPPPPAQHCRRIAACITRPRNHHHPPALFLRLSTLKLLLPAVAASAINILCPHCMTHTAVTRHTLRLACGGTQGRACCCCLSSKRCPPLLWRVNLKLHTAARGAAGGAAAPHAAPAFGLQKLARFAGEGAKGGRAAGGERRRGEKGRGCGDAQQQVLMASGWWRVQFDQVYKRCRSMRALHISPPLLGACALPPQK